MLTAKTHVWVNVRGKSGLVTVETIRESLDIDVTEFFGFLKGRMLTGEVIEDSVSPMIPGIILTNERDIPSYQEQFRKWLVEMFGPDRG
jgi:hypothetical protein